MTPPGSANSTPGAGNGPSSFFRRFSRTSGGSAGGGGSATSSNSGSVKKRAPAAATSAVTSPATPAVRGSGISGLRVLGRGELNGCPLTADDYEQVSDVVIGRVAGSAGEENGGKDRMKKRIREKENERRREG